MRAAFACPGFPPLEVPDANLMGIFSPAASSGDVAAEELIRRALEAPIGSPTLRDIARPRDRVLLLLDDCTRPTPVARLLPFVLDELREAGVRGRDIRFLQSVGSHRPMTPSELDDKLGPGVRDRYEIRAHDWASASSLTFLGVTSSGVEIQINRLIQEVDLIVGFGSIMPHRIAGFGGGGKIVMPGICGPVTTGQVHWASALYAGAEVLGRADNPMRRDIDEVAARAGLRFIVNTVMDGRGEIAHVVAGDPVAAHRRGAQLSRRVHEVKLPALADVVFIDSQPANTDLWVAAKGFFAGELAVRPGGAIVLVTPCPEGLAYGHHDVLERGYLPFRVVRELVESGELVDLTSAAHLGHMGRIVRDLATGIVVSPGLGPEVVHRLNLRHAPAPQEALELAFRMLGRDASVAVITHGAEALPVMARFSRPGAP